MNFSVSLVSVTAEASASATQVVDAISTEIRERAREETAFKHFGSLSVGLVLSHPLAGQGGRTPARARYDAKTNTLYASAQVAYESWVEDNWATRVRAAETAITAAIRAVARSRLSDIERSRAVSLVRDATDAVAGSPAAQLAALKPVFLIYYEGQERPTIAFDGPPAPLAAGSRVEELPSAAIASYLRHSAREQSPIPEMFKLHMRAGGRLCYYEAWFAENQVVEHWGDCGERGETSSRPVASPGQAVAALDKLKRDARSRGFAAIPPSRLKGLLVERAIDGFGSREQLEVRHRLQEFLDDRLGWLGLGHCDGGSTGSGSMEAHCLVVDAELALTAVRRELASSAFSDFNVRIARRGQ